MPAAIIDQIRRAFLGNPYPGDQFLVGSRDGCEPYDEVSQFFGCTDWAAIEPAVLDAGYSALSFFSEAGFRFFIPAYLIADLRGELHTADPTFHLTHGFLSFSSEYRGATRVFRRESGGDALLNPRRYGAVRWVDYARYRLSVFSREESAAIVEYLRHQRAVHSSDVDAPAIDAALASFWTDRAAHAPTAAELAASIEEDRAFAADLQTRLSDGAGGEPGAAR